MKPAAAIFVCALTVLALTPALDALPLGEFAKLDREAKAKKLGEVMNALATGLIDRLNGPVDSRGAAKTQERLQTDKKRAALVKQIVLNVDTTEVAVRIRVATSIDPTTELESVLVRYITDEVKRREEEARKKEDARKKG